MTSVVSNPKEAFNHSVYVAARCLLCVSFPPGLLVDLEAMCTSLTIIGWKRFVTRLCTLVFFWFGKISESKRDNEWITRRVSPSVCARRLPHRAVHPAQHHHAGEAADPEQHLWNRNPVRRLLSFFYFRTYTHTHARARSDTRARARSDTHTHACSLPRI